jgi:hypothetical protein
MTFRLILLWFWWERSYLIADLTVIFVSLVFVVPYFGLILEHHELRGLEKLREWILLIVETHVHASLVLDYFLLENFIKTLPVFVLLQKLLCWLLLLEALLVRH